MDWETSSLISIGPGIRRAGWGSWDPFTEPILALVVEKVRLGGERMREVSGRLWEKGAVRSLG